MERLIVRSRRKPRPPLDKPHFLLYTQPDTTILSTRNVEAQYVHTIINGKKFKALIDTGASGNFISRKACTKGHILTRDARSIGLRGIDGENFKGKGGTIAQETVPCAMQIGDHAEHIMFNVIERSIVEVVLGRS